MMTFLRALVLCVAMTCVAMAASKPAYAQTQSQAATEQPAVPKKSFLPPRAGSAAADVPQPPSGPLAGLYMWIGQQQRAFTSTLAGALRDIKSGNAVMASLVLIGFSFVYGVLHAAGPGHGKAIVSSYMLADGQTVRRGVQLAFLSSIVQAFSAIALFSIVVLALKGARSQILSTEALLERASWAIVAAFGAWLLFRQIRALIAGRPVHDHGHDHSHADHGHGHSHHAHDHKHGHGHAHHSHDHGHHHHDHKHDHSHDHANHAHAHGAGETCETCGHAHMPTADAVKGAWSWARAATMALAIGIRPCTGAIGVLFVANGLGLMWAGVVSTFMMAIGTAITVSGLAAMAAGSRDLATKIAGTADNAWASRAQTAFGLGGAALVFVLGSTFFYYSLTTTTPF